MLQKILEVEPELLLADGFDDCLMGLAIRDGHWVAMYSVDKIVNKLSESMTEDQAVEYFEFNIEGAYMGPKTPMFFWGTDPWDFSKGDEKRSESWSAANEEVRSTVSWREPT